jgi:hypothetical protein
MLVAERTEAHALNKGEQAEQGEQGQILAFVTE